MTIESICNQALDEIGYARHIGNIWEGTKAARALLDAWAETRDALLERTMPDWAKNSADLVLLKSAPGIVNDTADYSGGWNTTYPPIPWLYEYRYPVDCITPLQVQSNLLTLPMWRPQYNPFRLSRSSDGTTRTLLTNVPTARLVYIAQVNDPDDWHNEFVELMIMALAKKIQPGLMPRPAPQQREKQDADTAG